MTWLDRPTNRRSVADLADALAAGETTAEALLDEAEAAIADPSKPGDTAFIATTPKAARAAAKAADIQRAAGWTASPLAGVPISVKDLLDMTGEVTRAGSAILAGSPPAEADALAVARLRQAGAVVVGRTNMTEFAFSGLGLNPHYGTPGNPADRSRVPGGSSAGAGVSVVDGMAAVAIGTDTGGSVRIPAAFTGLVGYKTSHGRVPLDGCFPLSPSLDTIGPLAPSVACCATVAAIMAGQPLRPLQPIARERLRLAVAEGVAQEDLDDTVARAFARAVDRLSQAGARCEPIVLPEFEDAVAANRLGGLVVPEAYNTHAPHLASYEGRIDPRVLARIQRGASISANDLLDMQRLRASLVAGFTARLRGFDGVLLPTVPVVAPEIAPLEASDDVYGRTNALVLRNTSIGNVLNVCAVSLPCHAGGELPVGLQIMAPWGSDLALLEVAAAVEAVVCNPDG
ncbi:MAG: amidase [Rhodospirillaceae bacterium]|nr:amidase [Rhodospirillaceae bacterium]